MFIIDDIVLAPFRLFKQVLEKIRDTAYQEMYDPEKIKEEMKINQMLYELGEISKEKYEKRKIDLTHILEKIRSKRAK
ncbi:MAG: gas vesicle protein GvpG [Methanobacterium sp.]